MRLRERGAKRLEDLREVCLEIGEHGGRVGAVQDAQKIVSADGDGDNGRLERLNRLRNLMIKNHLAGGP